jgi:hypothetical protein
VENQKAKQPDSNKGILYDFIFIGLGAGNSLILLSLIKEACVVNKKIACVWSVSKVFGHPYLISNGYGFVRFTISVIV